MRVLVTGGCGFVGRNLVRALLDDDDVQEVCIIDDLSTGLHPHEWTTDERVRFIYHDVARIAEVDGMLGTYDQAFHLASIVGGRVKIEQEPLTVGLDLGIDAAFMHWAGTSGKVGRVQYASSSAAYPVMLQAEEYSEALSEGMVDLDADTLGVPDFTYGWAKMTGEYLVKLLVEKHGIAASVVRPFSGYGEDQDLTYPVPAIAQRAAQRQDPLTVWGTGHQARDFIHIDDCIQGMRRAMDRIWDGSAVNLGTGILTDFLTVARMCADAEGYEPEVKGTQEGPVGVHARYCDTARMHYLLNWEPSISLSEGLGRVVQAVGRV